MKPQDYNWTDTDETSELKDISEEKAHGDQSDAKENVEDLSSDPLAFRFWQTRVTGVKNKGSRVDSEVNGFLSLRTCCVWGITYGVASYMVPIDPAP